MYYYLNTDIAPEFGQILGDGIKLQVLEKDGSISEKKTHKYWSQMKFNKKWKMK